jgi:AMMECR1 domain-containing protein
LNASFSHARLIVSLICLSTLTGGNSAHAETLPAVVRETMQTYFEDPKADEVLLQRLKQSSADHSYHRKGGVFVTLSRNGKSRACWGSVSATGGDLVQETIEATVAALTKDYRYKPISRSEWRTLKPQVTVIDAVEPVDGIRTINPVRDGLMVRAGGKSGVLLPREALDPTYQLVQCKLKAGITPGESYQIFRLRAQVYE